MVLFFDLTSLIYSLALRERVFLFNSDVTFLREMAGTEEGIAILEIRKAKIFHNPETSAEGERKG